jgi:hypothetical protein
MSKTDLPLARALLDGLDEEDGLGRRRSRKDIPKKHERDARRAISNLLRSSRPLDRQLRESLADLFDPPDGARRKITIVVHGRGRLNDPVRKTQIAAHVHTRMAGGATLKAAVVDAAKKFCVSEDAIRKILAGYRKYEYGDLVG